MQSLLVDFLNHGILPFVGRSAEVQQIVEFWRGAADATGLRAAMVVGEAGIGKTRLIEELTPQILRSGGAVIHVRLYPDAASSIIPLIDRALQAFNTRRGAPHITVDDRPSPSAAPPRESGDVTAALRRVSRLRATLLIIEDIHLLKGKALYEFSTLLDALSNEAMSVLCLARPVQLSVRGILERYLVVELKLEGLKAANVEALWTTMFGGLIPHALINNLVEMTFGNPLAIRSAVRSAVQAKALTPNPDGLGWQVMLSSDQMTRLLSRNIGLLSEGMTAHLTQSEREAAQTIACLGELFAPESARRLLPDYDMVIEPLMFKGVVAAPSISPAPLPGSQVSPRPLAFTHSLLHRRLVASPNVDSNTLLGLVNARLPLYSTLPYKIIAQHAGMPSADTDTLAAMLDQTIKLSNDLYVSADSTGAFEMLEVADRIFEGIRSRIDNERAEHIEAALADARLTYSRYDDDPVVYEALAKRVVELTAEKSGLMVRHYLAGLAGLFIVARFGEGMISRDILTRIQQVVDERPEALETKMFVKLLALVGNNAVGRIDLEAVVIVERFLNAILAHPNNDEEFKQYARMNVMPFLVLSFKTPEEVRSREEFVRSLPPPSPSLSKELQMMKLSFLLARGQFIEALDLIEYLIPHFEKNGPRDSIISCHRFRIWVRTAFGADLEDTANELRRMFLSPTQQASHHSRDVAGAYCLEMGIMRGDIRWAWETANEIAVSPQFFFPEGRVLAAIAGLTDLHAIPQEEYAGNAFEALIEFAKGTEGVTIEDAFNSAIASLHLPMLRIDDLVTVRITLDLINAIGHDQWTDASMRETLSCEARKTLTQTLEYLADRSIYLYMTALLDDYGDYLTFDQKTLWRSRADALEARYGHIGQSKVVKKQLNISMLGTIQAQSPGGDLIAIRGSRLRALLGVMVADLIVEEPLSPREFGYIVSGIADDGDRTRKMLNGIVHRLRDVLGHDAIITGDGVPRLNGDIVQVDLVEAHELIKQTAAALRDHSLLRARQLLLEALRLSNGDVPFPTLYDEFFEALRDDFEQSLRTQIIKVSQQLLTEGDPDGARELLNLSCRAIPEDAELNEMLYQTLMTLGRRTEAQRLKMRTAVDS